MRLNTRAPRLRRRGGPRFRFRSLLLAGAIGTVLGAGGGIVFKLMDIHVSAQDFLVS